MANIGAFILKGDNWINLEAEIRKEVEDFTFTADKAYIVGFSHPCKVCIKEEGNTPATIEGFNLVEMNSRIGYTHTGGTVFYVNPQSTPIEETLYPSSTYEGLVVNIAE